MSLHQDAGNYLWHQVVSCLLPPDVLDPRSLSDRHDWIFTFRYEALMILSFSPLLWDAAVIDVRIFLIKRRDKKIDFTAVEKLVSWKMSGFTLMPLTSAWKVNRKGTISTIYLRLKPGVCSEKRKAGARCTESCCGVDPAELSVWKATVSLFCDPSV